MRYSSLVSFGLFCLASLMPQASEAAGNVLLPSTSNSSGTSSSLPNLGISTPAPATPNPSDTPPLPAAVTAPLPDVSPMQSPATIAVTPAISGSVPHPSAEEIARVPAGTVPTMIIHQPDESETFRQLDNELPNSLTLSISGKSYFGARDVEEISNKLGLSRDQVMHSCILTVRGLLQTSKTARPLLGGASPQVTVRYDGSITGYLMTAHAMCLADPSKLPTNSGMLVETNGRFTVGLQQIDCPPPNRQVSTLNITYDGSGTSQCAYE